MPRAKFSGWDGRQHRWRKEYKGVKYRVTCEELGLPPSQWTEAGSRQAAIAWFDRIKTTHLLTRTAFPVDPDIAERLDDVDERIAIAAEEAPGHVPELRKLRKRIEEADGPPEELPTADEEQINSKIDVLKSMGVDFSKAELDPVIRRMFFGDLGSHLAKTTKRKKVAAERTIGHALDRFLEHERGKQAIQTHNELASKLRAIPESVWTSETPTDSIDSDTVDRHFAWLSGLKLVSESHVKRLRFFRRFVVWMWERNLMNELPRNLKSKSQLRRATAKLVRVYTSVDEYLAKLPERHRTWALYALNTGSTAVDLGSVFWSDTGLDIFENVEVAGETIDVAGLLDVTKWTVTRRRVKIGKKKEAPTITYRLWPETVALLQKLPRLSPLVFLSTEGTPMYVVKEDVAKKDLFGDAWRDLKLTCDTDSGAKRRITFKNFRSIGCTALKAGGFDSHENCYLANVPRSIVEKHYGAPNDERFALALESVRTHLKIDALK